MITYVINYLVKIKHAISLKIIKQYATLLVKIFQEAIFMKIIIYALKNLTVEINTIIKLEN
jgi:hypothetical protein